MSQIISAVLLPSHSDFVSAATKFVFGPSATGRRVRRLRDNRASAPLRREDIAKRQKTPVKQRANEKLRACMARCVYQRGPVKRMEKVDLPFMDQGGRACRSPRGASPPPSVSAGRAGGRAPRP